MLEHPGKVIRDVIMRSLKKNGRQLSQELDIPIHEVARMVMGRRSMDEDFAQKLADTYPMLGTSPDSDIVLYDKDYWMQIQADYDREQASLPPEPAKYPGWHVVDKIMKGYYDDTGAWVVRNSLEIARILSLPHDDVQTLINPRPVTEAELNPLRTPIDLALANELAGNFPTIGMTAADWLQLQTDYDASLGSQTEQTSDQGSTPDSDRGSVPGLGNMT